MSDANDGKTDDANRLLDDAEAELKRGHFAAARELLSRSAKLDDKSQEAAERRAQLWARLAPDPIIPWLVAACVILYITLVAVFV